MRLENTICCLLKQNNNNNKNYYSRRNTQDCAFIFPQFYNLRDDEKNQKLFSRKERKKNEKLHAAFVSLKLPVLFDILFLFILEKTIYCCTLYKRR